MILSQCKKGDIVWIRDNVFKSYLKVRVGDITSDIEFLMPCVDVEILEYEDERANYQHCEFVTAECWTEKPEVKTLVNAELNKTEDEKAAYQCAYDLSNDWFREIPTWDDVQQAFLFGVMYGRKELKFDENERIEC